VTTKQYLITKRVTTILHTEEQTSNYLTDVYREQTDKTLWNKQRALAAERNSSNVNKTD